MFKTFEQFFEALYISFMKDFHYQLRHIPRVHNHTDALSWWPDHNNRSDDNEQVIALPDSTFIKVVSTTMLDRRLRKQQGDEHHLINEWKKKYCLCQKKDAAWYWGDTLVVTGGVEDHQALLATYHDALMVGHLGVTKTLKALTEDYWWPSVMVPLSIFRISCFLPFFLSLYLA